MRTVRDVFGDLQAEVEQKRSALMHADRVAARELVNNSGESFFLAVEPKLNKRMLIIPVTPYAGEVSLKRFPICHGTKVHKARFPKVGRLTDEVCLVISQTSSEAEIFELFATDVVQRLRHSEERRMPTITRQTMEKWQDFFRRTGEEGLSGEERRGLFGELYILRVMFEQGLDSDAIGCWYGPVGGKTDFVFGRVGLEVKTTMSANPLIATISNEEQLSCEGLRQLHLAVVPLKLTDQEGETLPDLVRFVRQRLRDWPLSLEAFDLLLVQYGYLDKQEAQYETERYSVLGASYFEVIGDFPRLTPEMLPHGVAHVRYQVILEGCSDFRREQSVVLATLREALTNGS